jgi:hypothetical protein
MIAGADASFYDTYPKGADPDTKAPCITWAVTPEPHLMAPMKQTDLGARGGALRGRTREIILG